MEDDKTLDLALWRYGIISTLLHREANENRLGELLEHLAQQSYVHPKDGAHVHLSPETIRKWFYRYQQGGLNGLGDKQRSDKGHHDVPTAIIDKMFELRKRHPRWTLALILKNLVECGLWNETTPSRSVLYRFAGANNLMRDPHRITADIIRPFAYDRFGQMWIADFMHGPKLWNGKKKQKSYLHIIIDDCTRYVVCGGFYPSESTEILIRELMTAVRRFGIAQRFYTDNGSAYSSRHLKMVCANLGMILCHTPPGRPQGRSKVERFFRTVREQLLASRHYKNFEDINNALALYLEEYHHRIHSTLQCSPMQKRLGVQSACKAVPEVADIRALFRISRRCRVYNDGAIRLKTRSFEVPGCLPGGRVTIHYMPWDLSRVYYGDDMHLAKEVNLSANARRFEHPNFEKETSHE